MSSITDQTYQPTQRQVRARRPIAYWLLGVAALVFAMVVVGGATRLTESGLSITEWKLVTGTLPPLSEEAWLEEFGKYKQIPQYELVNKGMSLAEFKYIYWWEWGHRLLGRFIGFAYALPFFFFLLTKRVEKPLVWRLWGLLALGGLQGAMGWFMVMSGLTERVSVSQYRLTAHLGLAFLIFGASLWVALDLLRGTLGQKIAWSGTAKRAGVLAGLVFSQVLLGGFVAGLRAGLSYNTWPLMDGRIVPRGLFDLSPWWINFFENHILVQFNHRMMAYAVFVFALYHLFTLKREARAVKMSGHILMAAILTQAVLGIWTLLAVVPVSLGVIHQGGAVLVLGAALVHLHLAGRR